MGRVSSGLEVVAVNPLRLRRFAEALGQLAKSDRVDAGMPARVGRLAGLQGTPPQPESLRQLHDLLILQRKLSQQRTALGKLHEELERAQAGRQARVLLRALERRLAALEPLIEAMQRCGREFGATGRTRALDSGNGSGQRRQLVRRHARVGPTRGPPSGRLVGLGAVCRRQRTPAGQPPHPWRPRTSPASTVHGRYNSRPLESPNAGLL